MTAAKKISPSSDEFLSRSEYDYFAKKMYDYSGVNLPFSAKNEALIKNRLTKLLSRNNISDLESLKEALESKNQKVVDLFISSLTTNKTHFFREDAHFDFFKEELNKRKDNSELRVWCSAASTGQEPYTIAIVLRENLQPAKLNNTKFLSTDIDLQVLAKASQGKYSESEMEGCPNDLRKKYFQTTNSKDAKYVANDELRNMIRFAPFNLVTGPYSFQHKFDFIFCRNVLIYFDPATTAKVIHNLASQLKPGGYLILGHSESGSVKDPLIKPLTRAIYQRLP